MSKLKEFADKIGLSQHKFFFPSVENIVGKGQNDGYQRFLPFPHNPLTTFIRVVVISDFCNNDSKLCDDLLEMH